MLAMSTRHVVTEPFMVIARCDRLNELVMTLVSAFDQVDVPYDEFTTHSSVLTLVNEVVSALWRGEEVDWAQYSLDSAFAQQALAWLLANDNPIGLYRHLAYAITVPDLSGTLIFHFHDPLRRF